MLSIGWLGHLCSCVCLDQRGLNAVGRGREILEGLLSLPSEAEALGDQGEALHRRHHGHPHVAGAGGAVEVAR